MVRNFIIFALLVLSQLSVAAPSFADKSAHREPGQSYLDYKARIPLLRVPNDPNEPVRVTAEGASVPYDPAKLPLATEWQSADEMLKRFQAMRDYRWLQTGDRPNFSRRLTWLYPDDGCFARAALAVMNLKTWGNEPPSKVFAFGNLLVKTANSLSGSVSWWYHVAPLVQVSGQKYVLDPALEPTAPLKLEEWLARMSQDISKLEVAVCGSGSYVPSDDCVKDTDGVETTAAVDINDYLRAEWSRMVQLQRDPSEVLGANPPWTLPAP